MASESKVTIIARLISYLPDWFGDVFPLVESILEGIAENSYFIYTQYLYAFKQTRIKTATDENLDLIAKDFFGLDLQRHHAESDERFRRRILSAILREKATRTAMRDALFELTGFEPIIFEPMRPLDTGAYNSPETLGYNIAGAYSAGNLAYTAFITVFRPFSNGLSSYAALNVPNSGYNVIQSAVLPVANAYGSQAMLDRYISDDDIYFVINTTKPNSTRIWVRIVDKEV